MSVTGANLTYEFAADTALPSGATHFLVYSRNATGESTSATYLAISDVIDSTASIVSRITPAGAASNVSLLSTIQVTFSEAMAGSSITSSNIKLLKGATPTPGSIAHSGAVATFTPTIYLEFGQTYSVQIGTGVTDSASYALA